MNNLNQQMVGMSNNLTQCIEQSGMTNNEVAAAKGVTPETLRRHRNGKIQMTIKDAEHYARILDVTIQKVLFQAAPIPVLGTFSINKEQVKRTMHTKKQYEVYANTSYPTDRACFLWEIEKPYNGDWYEFDGAITFVRLAPIVDKYIDPDCFQFISTVKTKSPVTSKIPGLGNFSQDIIAGELYPQPKGLFTVHNGKTKETYEGLELEWATPNLSVVFRPDLCNMHVNKVAD